MFSSWWYWNYWLYLASNVAKVLVHFTPKMHWYQIGKTIWYHYLLKSEISKIIAPILLRCCVVTIATDFQLKTTEQHVSKVSCDPLLCTLLS